MATEGKAMDMRETFEKAVIARLKEGGFLEVEIRVECLPRSGDGYRDGSVDAYWHFYQQSRADLVVELPKDISSMAGPLMYADDVRAAINAAGLVVNQRQASGIDLKARIDVQQRLTVADQRADVLEGLLRLARQFVINGVELGYITMPDPATPDSAHDLLPKIDAALKPAEGGRDE